MQEKYIKFAANTTIPYLPIPAYDTGRKVFVHLYENIELEPSTFKEEVNLYLSRKESFSGSVVTVNKVKDEHIAINQGVPAMQVTVVTDYIPWRFHLINKNITYEQALFLLDGSVKGFRQLLHRIKTPFLIEKYMIGVDYKGEVKVWWNEHFHRNKFSFKLTSETKLKDMVLSLVSKIVQKLDMKDRKIIESNLFVGQEVSFVSLEKRIGVLSKGLSLRVVGQNLIGEIFEVGQVTKKIQQNSTPLLEFRPRVSQLRVSKISSAQKSVLVVPDSPLRLRKDTSGDKLITKRVYKEGTAPELVEKMNIIKEDILRLREVANINQKEKNGSSTLRYSKSLSSFTSYNRGVFGNELIPQVSRLVKQSQILDKAEEPTVSVFVEPVKSEILHAHSNPEKCEICTGVQGLRKSQMSSGKSEFKLSRVKSLENLVSDRDFFSTERSINQSKMEISPVKDRFVQSERKLPGGHYFSTLLE